MFQAIENVVTDSPVIMIYNMTENMPQLPNYFQDVSENRPESVSESTRIAIFL